MFWLKIFLKLSKTSKHAKNEEITNIFWENQTTTEVRIVRTGNIKVGLSYL